MLKAKSSENFVPPQKCQILAVFGTWGSGLRKSFDFYFKIHIYTWIHVVCVILKIGLGVWPPGRLGKNKVTNIVYFTYLPRSPRCSDRQQICSGGWFPGHNQLCQISFQSVQGFWFCRGSNFGLSHIGMRCPWLELPFSLWLTAWLSVLIKY